MPCNLIAEAGAWLEHSLPVVDWSRVSGASAAAFALVTVAEMGDKSQWVCMALAARHRHWPVFGGAVLAFAVLNALAVAFGAVAGRWLPEQAVALAVALIFAVFGLRSLLSRHTEENEEVSEKSGHGIFATTFLMIFLAEFGDKTQIAVAGLGAADPAIPVWLGATAALALTSALGVWAGKTLVRRLPPRALSVTGGLLFLAFAAFAAWQAVPAPLRASLLAQLLPR